jgi:hypothetical protein
MTLPGTGTLNKWVHKGDYYTIAHHDLHVVDQCQCNCVSIDFETAGQVGGTVIADAVATWPDGSRAGIML